MSESELDARRIRAAKNQSLFREVNERIQTLRPLSTAVEFVCECLDEGCTTHLDLSAEDYEAIRADPTHFVIAPGHEDPHVETMVLAREGWVVVQKIGAGGRVAKHFDPRGRTATA